MAFWERWQGPIVQQDGYSVRGFTTVNQNVRTSFTKRLSSIHWGGTTARQSIAFRIAADHSSNSTIFDFWPSPIDRFAPLLNARSTTWRCWQASAARHLRQSTRLDKIKNIRIKIQLGSVGSTGDSLRQYQDSIGNRV